MLTCASLCPLQLFFLISVHAHNLCPWLDKDGELFAFLFLLLIFKNSLRSEKQLLCKKNVCYLDKTFCLKDKIRLNPKTKARPPKFIQAMYSCITGSPAQPSSGRSGSHPAASQVLCWKIERPTSHATSILPVRQGTCGGGWCAKGRVGRASKWRNR
jgi:hypothetical protein